MKFEKKCQGRFNGGVTPFHVEIMAANQPKFIFMLENLCYSIVTVREEVLSRIKSLVSEYYKHFGKNCDF